MSLAGSQACAAQQQASANTSSVGGLPTSASATAASSATSGFTAVNPRRAAVMVAPSTPDRGTRRSHRPVADPPLHLGVGIGSVRPQWDTHLDQHLVVRQRRLIGAFEEVVDRISRDPEPAAVQTASSTAHTVVRSSAGSAWHSDPPTVPRFRTTGSAISSSASRKIGHTAASASDSNASPVPSHRADPHQGRLDDDVPELSRQVVDVDEVFRVGDAQLHHRQQAVPACDDQRPVAQPVEQPDCVVNGLRALIFERSGTCM